MGGRFWHAQPTYQHLMRLLDWRPAEGLLPRARGRDGPGVATLEARGGAGPLPGGNRGVRTPEASWRDRPIGVWLPHVAAPDPLGGPGLWWPSPSTLSSWARGGAGPIRARGEVRRPRSQLSGPGRTSLFPEDKGEVTDNLVSIRVDRLSDDSLTG
jgi:hypothetical protein